MLIRYCPVCETEFRPEIERCSDCGGPLEARDDSVEEGAIALPGAHGPLGAIPEGDYRPLFRDMAFDEADAIAARLGQAGVPYQVSAGPSLGFVLSVRKEDEEAAIRAAGVQQQPPASEGREETSEEQGPQPCPACGQVLGAGVAECPSCGLGFEPLPLPECPRCHGTLPSREGPCPNCDG